MADVTVRIKNMRVVTVRCFVANMRLGKNVRSADKSMLFCFRPVYKVVEKGVNSKPGYGLYACFAGYVLAVRYDGVYRYIVALGYFFVCVSVGKACEYFFFSGREFGVVVSVFFSNRVPVPDASVKFFYYCRFVVNYVYYGIVLFHFSGRGVSVCYGGHRDISSLRDQSFK